MSDLQITETRMRFGVWEGIVRGADDQSEPALRVTFQDTPVADVTLRKHADGGAWTVCVPVPKEAICDGVQTILITDPSDDRKLADFTLVGGDVLTDDIRAEVELLRAELDMLKRAFRRHCLETE